MNLAQRHRVQACNSRIQYFNRNTNLQLYCEKGCDVVTEHSMDGGFAWPAIDLRAQTIPFHE